jgi:pyruvate dehydrogenase E1 component
VRGNGQIIQELEAAFRGAGWNVIKVLWGGEWDRCSTRTRTACSSSGWARSSTANIRSTRSNPGAYVREHFWGKYPQLLEMVSISPTSS